MKVEKLKRCKIGNRLLKIFSLILVLAVITILPGFFGAFSNISETFASTWFWVTMTIVVTLVETVIFWIGIILVYISSTQLGISIRVWGLICGLIPIAHLIMLGKIIRVTSKEVKLEESKIKLNEERKAQQICKTKYPILMVHGVFFRDFEHLNYWGRIPAELEKNGATCFYGNHNSAASVRDSGVELKNRILEIIKQTGCEKVNIIAHSKGGLDSRCAISLEGMAPYVASLTTINTPHRGCEFADYLLNKIPANQQQNVAKVYNASAAKLGDVNPDFLSAVYDLTHSRCEQLNKEVLDSDLVYYQSVGSKLNKSVSGQFPLNFTYHLVNHFDGANDGLVGENSFNWGDKFTFYTTKGKRGISHGDVIDLNRENIDGFDVREIYVQIVADLKNKGF